MFLFVLTLHFILCAILVGLVLIQQGKGADMGAAFGAGGSNSLFGAGGATSLIVRITTGTAIAFMVTSILLINLSGAESGLAANAGAASPQGALAGSVMQDVAPAVVATTASADAAAPVADAAKAPAGNAAPSSAAAVVPENKPAAPVVAANPAPPSSSPSKSDSPKEAAKPKK